ncbi:endoribonuclease YbeY [Clostridia bacterium]|nr:endoribonuclease YbeY [Clostridia bacterium]
MTILVEEEYEGEYSFPLEQLAGQVIEAAADTFAVPYEFELSILLVGEEEIRQMNKEQRGIDRVTDVLSFPMIDFRKAGDFSDIEKTQGNFDPDSGEALLGDMVLCVPKMKAQAKEYGHSEKREFAFLVLHSLLHLLGYDHESVEEAEHMERIQENILSAIGIGR